MTDERTTDFAQVRSPWPREAAEEAVFRQTFLRMLDHRDRFESVVRTGEILRHYAYDNTGVQHGEETVGEESLPVRDDLRAFAGDLQNLAFDLRALERGVEWDETAPEERVFADRVPGWAARIEALADEIFTALGLTPRQGRPV